MPIRTIFSKIPAPNFQSRALARKTMDDLNLWNRPMFIGAYDKRSGYAL